MSTPKAKRFAARTPALDNISQIADNRRDLGVPVQLIPMADIALDPHNPRKLALDPNDPTRIDPTDPAFELKQAQLEDLRTLAQTIAKEGLHNPVQVYRRGDGFVLFIGQRRFLAHRLLGQSAIRASVYHERPHHASLWQFTENFQRVDISLHERIDSLREILEELGHTDSAAGVMADALQEHAGLGRAIAYRYVSILNGPEVVRHAIREGRLTSVRKAAELAQLDAIEAGDAIAAYEHGGGIATVPSVNITPAVPTTPIPAVRRQGRPAQAVSLPKVKNPETIRLIMERVLGAEAVPAINWDDYRQVGQAFADMIKRLESSQA